ncbi:MAG: hypothetical protein OEZ47_16195, partial [Gammaproteobacteria bacterium]|nr:hypothetical protein [Gammaproteobacteria bacterium]
MNIKLINGRESVPVENQQLSALSDFYKGFNTRDLSRVKNNWLNSGHVSMFNPLGGIKRGWEEIEGVYRRIFQGNANVYVEFYDFEFYETGDMCIYSGREKGFVTVGSERLDLAIRTSRTFIKNG